MIALFIMNRPADSAVQRSDQRKVKVVFSSIDSRMENGESPHVVRLSFIQDKRWRLMSNGI